MAGLATSTASPRTTRPKTRPTGVSTGDLDAHVAAIAARGLDPDERGTLFNGVCRALYRAQRPSGGVEPVPTGGQLRSRYATTR